MTDWQLVGVVIAVPAVVLLGNAFWRAERRYEVWISYPSVQEYLSRSGQKGVDGIKCITCGSREIWRYGQDIGWRKWGYLHQCHQCGTWLYRTGV